ncbi:MAG: hypothetical protein JSW73_02355 [Candidatus Woesearchaeota archaeon]|nr:MAG: hypothetical protein JSW73_02355 [Candidatus Woesearchaeota archaeon]
MHSKKFSARLLSPVFEEACVQGLNKYGKEFFKLDKSIGNWFKYVPTEDSKGEVNIWVLNSTNERFLKNVKKNILTDSEYLKNLEKIFLKEFSSYHYLAEKTFKTNYENKNSKELIKELSEFNNQNQRTTCIYNAPIVVLEVLEQILYSKMNNYEDFLVISTVAIPSPIKKQKKQWKEIIEVAKKGEDYEDKLTEYWKEWMFLSCTDVLGTPYTIEHFQKQLENDLKKDIKEDQTDLENQRVSKIIEKYTSLKKEINWLRRWQDYRNNKTEEYYSQFQWFRPLFECVAKKLNVSYDELLMLSVPEMIKSLQGEDYTKEIKIRMKKGFTLKYENEVILYSGVKEKDIIIKEPPKRGALQGRIACAGYAKGKARIVKDPHKIKNFQRGDILVSSFTSPSFVPLIEKAGAILTDEGGILSHAAIISREMNKPCIIGLKNATKILVDGEIVEVDANLGIVVIKK